MGCDIHLYDEKFQKGKWQIARPDVWCIEYPDEVSHPDISYKKRIYHDRNYNLFAILADVRNGRGFAGCDTGDGFNPIAPPRGLPKDVSTEVKAVSDGWSCNGHSHSWLTLQELLDYDWTQTTKCRGWIDALTHYDWSMWERNRNEGPREYCGGISGGRVQHISAQEMEVKINEIKKVFTDRSKIEQAIEDRLPSTYCLVEWTIPYYKCVRSFWSDAIPQLLHLGKPDEVRIVFWFDN